MRLHPHRWVIAAANAYRRTDYTQVLNAKDGKPVTLVLYRCTRCPKTRTIEMDGHWTLPALTGAHHVDTGNAQ